MDAQKYTQNSLQAIQAAQGIAMDYGNAELTCTHLCLALLNGDGLIPRIITRIGGDTEGFTQAVREEVERSPAFRAGTPTFILPPRFPVCCRLPNGLQAT